MHNLKIFIWQGAWQGGAETVMLDIAKFLRDHYNIKPVLGVFKGESDPKQDFKQIEIPRIFPKKLVAYNQVAASLLLGRQLSNFDLVITHCGGFWKRPSNFFVYREPGDLDAMLRALPLRSKLLYSIPYLVALSSLKRGADLPMAASHRAVDFFTRHGVKDFFPTTNFVNTANLPSVSDLSYEEGEKFRVTFVGRDDKLKRLDLLKQAVALLKDPLVELHIFGVEGQDVVNLKYHGWQRQDAVEQFLAHHTHVFVLPSLFEASPLTLLTALALGVPSVCSNNALPREYETGVNGFNLLQELESKLGDIKATYADYKQAAKNYATTVRSDYDINRVLAKELDYVLRCVDKQERGSRSWQVAQAAELDCWVQNKQKISSSHYLESKKQMWQNILASLSPRLSPADLKNKSVLEFGCGPAGMFTLIDKNPSYTCLDPLMNKYLRYFDFIHSSNVKFVGKKLEDFNADSKFDIILGFNALDHVDSIKQALNKLYHLAGLKTLLVISVHTHASSLWQKILSFAYPILDRPHKHQYTDRQYQTMFESQGFRLINKICLDSMVERFVRSLRLQNVEQPIRPNWRGFFHPANWFFGFLKLMGWARYGYEKPSSRSVYKEYCYVLTKLP